MFILFDADCLELWHGVETYNSSSLIFCVIKCQCDENAQRGSSGYMMNGRMCFDNNDDKPEMAPRLQAEDSFNEISPMLGSAQKSRLARYKLQLEGVY